MTTLEEYEAAKAVVSIYEADQRAIVDAGRLRIQDFIRDNKLSTRLRNALRELMDFYSCIYIDELFVYKHHRLTFLWCRNAGFKSLEELKTILEEKYHEET